MKRERYKVDFKAMLADCEANYARVLRLFPDIMSSAERRVGLGKGGDILEFSVLERTAYTTLVSLGHVMAGRATENQADALRPPVLRVRLYHDAKLAEVIACQRVNYVQSKNVYPNEHMLQPDEKFQWNHFLGEWLAHCLAHGYAVEEAGLPLC